jgi:hypothetical protein
MRTYIYKQNRNMGFLYLLLAAFTHPKTPDHGVRSSLYRVPLMDVMDVMNVMNSNKCSATNVQQQRWTLVTRVNRWCRAPTLGSTHSTANTTHICPKKSTKFVGNRTPISSRVMVPHDTVEL